MEEGLPGRRNGINKGTEMVKGRVDSKFGEPLALT